MTWQTGLLLLVAFELLPGSAFGFDMTRHNVPVEEILSGGPRKDGIPALRAPRVVAPVDASFLHPADRVVGVAADGAARAYPITILNWHEAVNDTVGAQPIVVTYCPLTDSAVVFERTVDGRLTNFGISGLLYQSNVLLYDARTDSLWSQLAEHAVAGEMTGSELRPVASTVTTWADWQRAHPQTTVLSSDTGHERDYTRDPYTSYRRQPVAAFPVGRTDARLPSKERVLGLRLRRVSRAYPLAQLAHAGQVRDLVSGTAVTIDYDPALDRAIAIDSASGRQIPATVLYWFAWAAFHPETSVWGADLPVPTPRTLAPADLAGSAAGNAAVEIVTHRAYWTSLLGLAHRVVGDAAQAPKLLVIRGDLRNASEHPLHHVVLLYELLDDSGTVVAAEHGYNLSGEALRQNADQPILEGDVGMTVVENTPLIMPGDTDAFRMILVSDEIPAFISYRVRVVAAPRLK
jgi:Protein of unknown function (DUF3179)